MIGAAGAAIVQRLLDLTQDGVVVVAGDGSVLAHNAAAADLLALHPDDLQRQRFTHHRRATVREVQLSDARGERRQVVVRADAVDWFGTPADLVVLHARTLDDAVGQDDGAFHDRLTGLPGRELLRNRLHDLVRGGQPVEAGALTLVRIDLDRFRNVNDRHGPAVGDAVLQGVANRLTLAVRPGDYVARLGEDDFMVVLVGADAAGGHAVASRVLTALRRPFEIEGHTVRCQPAAALTRHRPGQSEADLLAAAEDELIANPINGLDDPAPPAGGPAAGTGPAGPRGASRPADGERLGLTPRAASRTLDDHNLDVHYLPRVDLGDGRLDGLQARIYRDHPDDGVVPVEDLWRVAEQGGALLRPGEWLLREVLDQALEWRERRGDTVIPPVTVTLGSNELLDPELGRELALLLGRRGVSPAALRIGVDAAVLLDSSAAVVAALDKLLADGLRLEVVDFGAGSASLRVLAQKGVGAVALDARLLDRVPDDEEVVLFVQAVINAAHTLGIRVTATGVERADQRAALYRWGCDAAEGPAVGPPLTALEAAGRLVTTSPGRLAGAPLLRSRGR